MIIFSVMFYIRVSYAGLLRACVCVGQMNESEWLAVSTCCRLVGALAQMRPHDQVSLLRAHRVTSSPRLRPVM